METRAIYSDFKAKILFKSYYVVWKPAFSAWLPPVAYLFKSYYVVWKRIFRVSECAKDYGLNRTM